MRRIHYIFCIILTFVAVSNPCSAVYDFEEIPFEIAAQGEIEGAIYTYGTYGLSDPPMECEFSLPGEPVWARVYTGVWGGTEKYSGSAEISVNSLKKYKYSLFGEQDKNENVYCTGYGVYWIAQDATGLLHRGENSITVDTSRGDEGNRLDGRVYGIQVVAAVKDGSGDKTQYWVYEGNANLHGEGWSGNVPTIHNSESITFSGADLTGMRTAELTTLLLTSTRYQPDYVSFNSHGLGIEFSNSDKYPDGSTDIGDECCFNANGGTGIQSRYIDVETFDVSGYVSDENTVLFERGRDDNGDGTIDPSATVSEGEDYLHPCLAILAIKKNKGALLSDFGIETVSTENLYSGTTGTITAEVRNYGGYTSSPVAVGFYANDNKIGTGIVEVDSSGIGYASTEWPGASGEYRLSAKIESPTDSRPENNEYTTEYVVEDLPDLSVRISDPVRAGSEESAEKQTPGSVFIPLAGIAAAGVFLYRRNGFAALPALFIVTMIVISPCMIQPSYAGDGGYTEYVLPVEVVNSGGSTGPGISVTVYLDGEKAAYTTLEEGIGGGKSKSVNISIFTTPGRHDIRIVVDEENSLNETDEDNNSAGGTYEFP